jgi:hypothetical protein
LRAEELNIKIQSVQNEIQTLERNSEEAHSHIRRNEETSRFLGRLEQALQLYNRADSSSETATRASDIAIEISKLRKKINERQLQERLSQALRKISSLSNTMVQGLDAEWPNADIQLNIKELTIQIQRGDRLDYLWEIGSGANWLAYHIVVSLALQRFFLELPHHPVPAFLIFDQPSQVYFPRTATSSDGDEDLQLKDEDVDAVRKVFRLLAKATQKYPGRLQIIVLDHADDEVWGGIENLVCVDNWRGSEKLVPIDWEGAQDL